MIFKNRNEIIKEIETITINDCYIYPYIIKICALLARKKEKNKYDKEKATRAFFFPVELAMRAMQKSTNDLHEYIVYRNWYEILTVKERLKASTDLLEYYTDIIEEMENGAFKHFCKYIYYISNQKLKIEKFDNLYFLPGGREVTKEEYDKYIKA